MTAKMRSVDKPKSLVNSWVTDIIMGMHTYDVNFQLGLNHCATPRGTKTEEEECQNEYGNLGCLLYLVMVFRLGMFTRFVLEILGFLGSHQWLPNESPICTNLGPRLRVFTPRRPSLTDANGPHVCTPVVLSATAPGPQRPCRFTTQRATCCQEPCKLEDDDWASDQMNSAGVDSHMRNCMLRILADFNGK